MNTHQSQDLPAILVFTNGFHGFCEAQMAPQVTLTRTALRALPGDLPPWWPGPTPDVMPPDVGWNDFIRQFIWFQWHDFPWRFHLQVKHSQTLGRLTSSHLSAFPCFSHGSFVVSDSEVYHEVHVFEAEVFASFLGQTVPEIHRIDPELSERAMQRDIQIIRIYLHIILR